MSYFAHIGFVEPASLSAEIQAAAQEQLVEVCVNPWCDTEVRRCVTMANESGRIDARCYPVAYCVQCWDEAADQVDRCLTEWGCLT